MMTNIIAAETLIKRDDFCTNYLKAFRTGQFEVQNLKRLSLANAIHKLLKLCHNGYYDTIGICQNLLGIGIRNTKVNFLSNINCKLIDCLNMLAFWKGTASQKLFAGINRTNAKKSLPTL
jgi:hypothetical protein